MLDVYIPYGVTAASSRTRVFSWLDRTGVTHRMHQFTVGRDHQPRTLLRHGLQIARFEVQERILSAEALERVLIARQASAFSNGALEKRITARADFSVYDFDDALAFMPAVGPLKLWSKAKVFHAALGSVDRVIAGSHVLAEAAASVHDDVVYIPTCVDPLDYTEKHDFNVDGAPRLVWLGSPSVERNLEFLAPALATVNKETGARLTVISSGNRDLGPVGDFIDRVEWSPTVESSLSQYDVAIAPLTDGPVERGKCAYKVLQYGAAALPTVASPVGANAYVLEDLGGMAAKTIDGWTDALMDILLSSAAVRQRMGEEARRAVVDGYSYEAWEGFWLEKVAGIGGSNPAA